MELKPESGCGAPSLGIALKIGFPFNFVDGTERDGFAGHGRPSNDGTGDDGNLIFFGKLKGNG